MAADTCRSCEAPVIFVPSAKSGKPMILDAEPEKRLVLVDRFSPGQLGNPGRQHAARVVDVYVDHHSTCPNVGRRGPGEARRAVPWLTR